MPLNRWGHRMIPGESYPINSKGILHLKQVSIDGRPTKGKTILTVQAKGQSFVLCTLMKNRVERVDLSYCFIAEDEAKLILTGANPVNLFGSLEEDDGDESSTDEDSEDAERETITGQPRYTNYLSDLLGPDLPDEDDEEYKQVAAEEAGDEFGTLAFRDPTDNEFLGGFELRHFNLAPNIQGYKKVDLRKQEETMEDSLLNDNIAKALVNSLINSGNDFQVKKGREFMRKLKKQCKDRKRRKLN